MSTCRSCGAAIVWAKTSTGKTIPLDAAPSPRGNMILDEQGVALVVPTLSGFGPWMISHFATCPNAAQHRKPKAPAAKAGA